jgi:hypothetical protein
MCLLYHIYHLHPLLSAADEAEAKTVAQEEKAEAQLEAQRLRQKQGLGMGMGMGMGVGQGQGQKQAFRPSARGIVENAVLIGTPVGTGKCLFIYIPWTKSRF